MRAIGATAPLCSVLVAKKKIESAGQSKQKSLRAKKKKKKTPFHV
jgi:hypothetical protein